MPKLARRLQRRLHRARGWYLFLIPFFLVFSVFLVFPVCYSLLLSFTEADFRGIVRFLGLGNYVRLLKDPVFWVVIRNTFQYTFTYILFGLSVALFFAILLNRKIRFQGVFRVLFFIPVITPEVAVAKVWQQLYNNDFGLLNRILRPLGLARNWLNDARLVLWAIAALAIWNGLGYYIVLFLAGLQAIPQELYEAAQIDGATPTRQFWSVTLPSLAPTVVLTSILAGINCLQVFTPIDLLTKGGPVNASNTIGFFMYKHAFQWFNRGYASAISYVLFLIILAFSITQRTVINRWLGEG